MASVLRIYSALFELPGTVGVKRSKKAVGYVQGLNADVGMILKNRDWRREFSAGEHEAERSVRKMEVRLILRWMGDYGSRSIYGVRR
jgi:hypothetical protein